ncbi:MAG TPA: ABC transporter permease subunit, partial [Candidatus Acetothermia bacterium]|nr:ABC transporter permease subunit [Candidatus Acetothermia bacterium]
MKGLWRSLKRLRQYPSAVAGLGIILFLVVLSVYAVISIPYGEAIRLWRGGSGVWDEYPRNAAPVWTDWFTSKSLSRTMRISSADGHGMKTITPTQDGQVAVRIELPVEYTYDTFPRELTVYLRATFEEARTPYSVFWVRPDGSSLLLKEDRRGMRSSDAYYISQDQTLRMRMPSRVAPEIGLLADLEALEEGVRVPEKGEYRLVVETVVPEGFAFDARLLVYGEVHGIAGTDGQRRDMRVALLWGAPLALVFGLLGAVGANITTFVLAGIGTWYGGFVDWSFQRLTQLNMLLPLLPILIMIGQFYSKSLWIMLGTVIALSIFSGAYLTYRAMFLQAKESPYIEAAKAYGASNNRIVFRYLLPRIIPVLLPSFVLVIPSFVFLEASLAVLGLG